MEYFNQPIEEKNQKLPDSLSTRLVKTRLELAQTLGTKNSSDTGDLRQTLLDTLHQHVATMEPDNFLVRPHLKQIEDFSNRERWEHLSEEDTETIADNLASLPNGIPSEDRFAKEFDLLCLKLQLAVLKQSADFIRLRDKVRDLMAKLEDKKTIPMVQAQLPLIEEIQPEDWWTNVTPNLIEHARCNLRDLIKFIERQSQTIVYTNFADQMGRVKEAEVPVYQPGFSPYQYRKKVETYIRANENHVAIAKLKRNLPLTEPDLEALETMLFDAEEIESRERFEEVYGKDLSLKLFIRKLVGCDRNAAKEAFASYLVGNTMSANQIRFIENIIDYLTQNGVMDPGLLYEPPFTELHDEGLDGIFQDDDADEIIGIVRSFNKTVEANFGVA